MHTESHRLDLHRAFGALAPRDGLPGRGGQGLDQLLDRVKRRRTGLAWLPTSLVDGWLESHGLHLLGQTAAEGALHRTHVGDLALIESSEKVGIVSVARINHHCLDRHAPLPGSIQQPQGNLWLGLLADLLWHLCLLSALGILSPGLRQKQLGA